jgi:hypothetical protein
MKVIDTFTLDREKPKIEFTLNSKDSFLLIENIHLITQKNENGYWKNIVSSIEINVVLKYIVYVDLEGRFIDDRTKEFSIPLMPELNQIQPIININRRITNETISIGWNPDKKFYTALIIELNEIPIYFTLKNSGIPFNPNEISKNIAIP